jgi:hypothetical protein
MGAQDMSQAKKPTGFVGRFLARGMAWDHRSFYKNAAKALNLRPTINFLR